MTNSRIDYERKLALELARIERRVEALFLVAAKEAAGISGLVHDLSPDKPFSFTDYPLTKSRVDKMLGELSTGLVSTIVKGIDVAWALSEGKNDELVKAIFGKRNVAKMNDESRRRYFADTSRARKAFHDRKISGLSLSDRVWRYVEQFKEEIELGLDCGIRDGVGAAEMARELRKYLREPDRLFRRVRNKFGQLVLSKAAKAYHPGQGVYRSSYKNARRLAATETSIAYRTADHDRWGKMDFVVGIEVKLSNNHTLNGEPFVDICDDLAGKYPKDFKFVGWHPLCRCYVVSILKTQEEFLRDLDGVDRGSVNAVKDVPEGFKAWCIRNEERIDGAEERGTLPYFIRDNRDFVDRALGRIVEPPVESQKPTILERAAARHAARTPEQIADIKAR